MHKFKNEECSFERHLYRGQIVGHCSQPSRDIVHVTESRKIVYAKWVRYSLQSGISEIRFRQINTRTNGAVVAAGETSRNLFQPLIVSSVEAPSLPPSNLKLSTVLVVKACANPLLTPTLKSAFRVAPLPAFLAPTTATEVSCITRRLRRWSETTTQKK